MLDKLPLPVVIIAIAGLMFLMLVLALMLTHRDRVEWSFWNRRLFGLRRYASHRNNDDEG